MKKPQIVTVTVNERNRDKRVFVYAQHLPLSKSQWHRLEEKLQSMMAIFKQEDEAEELYAQHDAAQQHDA